METKERKELFFNLLGAELVKEGFGYRKSINGFIKKENGNEYLYTFEIWPHFMQVAPDFSMLIKSVEDVKKKAWGKLYKKSCSVGDYKDSIISIAKIEDSSTSWTDTETAVKIAVEKEIKFYNSYLKKYYEKYSTIQILDEYLNSEPYEHRILAYNHIHTSFLAIIVAKLNNNSKLLELLPFYKAIVQKFNKDYIEEFELLERYVTNDNSVPE